MASFDNVNYSLRPSKSIQRQIVFDGIGALKSLLGLSNAVYIGFGSIWFIDFVMAHKLLDINDMISMESDEVGYRRAVYNKPYATIDVRAGRSSCVLTELFGDLILSVRPWVIWLDYDQPLVEELTDDIRLVIERAPTNTVFLITFDGKDNRANYGRPKDRVALLRALLGDDIVPDGLCLEQCEGDQLRETLADLTINFMKSMAVQSARKGGFVPAFRMIYEDSSPMVTIGGILPSLKQSSDAERVISTETWKCRFQNCRIVAPLLTIREAATLQSLLPRSDPLTRQIIREHGFDLEEPQIESFEKYYREYPTFAQIIP